MLDKQELRKMSSELISNPNNYFSSFRRNIELYISRKEITLQEVSELAEIPLPTLKTFLYGDSKDCHLSTAVKLARVFNVSMDELVGAGTISPQTCESLQLTRQLPESFTYFVRWAIHFHHEMITSNKVSKEAVEVMEPEIDPATGNLHMTNNFEIIDISDVSPDVKPKIFMGIRIPSNMYAPKYYEGEILLIANDRNARHTENVFVCTGNNMWILSPTVSDEGGVRKTVYRSIRDGRVVAVNDDGHLILGYIAGKK